jgi:hypothetical protein
VVPVDVVTGGSGGSLQSQVVVEVEVVLCPQLGGSITHVEQGVWAHCPSYQPQKAGCSHWQVLSPVVVVVELVEPPGVVVDVDVDVVVVGEQSQVVVDVEEVEDVDVEEVDVEDVDVEEVEDVDVEEVAEQPVMSSHIKSVLFHDQTQPENAPQGEYTSGVVVVDVVVDGVRGSVQTVTGSLTTTYDPSTVRVTSR